MGRRLHPLVPDGGEYAGYWLREIVKPNLAPGSYVTYEVVVRLYLVPGLGRKRLDKLRVSDVDRRPRRRRPGLAALGSHLDHPLRPAGRAAQRQPLLGPALGTAEVRRITVRDARRTCASLLADLDVHPRMAIQILRHAQFAVTMEIYTVVSLATTRDVLKRLGKALDR